MIDQADIHAALMWRCEAISLNPMPEIAWPGKPAPQAAYWLRVTHLPNIPDRPSLDGSLPLDHQGILQLDLMNEPGQHEISYLKRASALISQFPQNLRFSAGTARVVVVKAYALGGRATGDHWMIPVRVEYRVEAA